MAKFDPKRPFGEVIGVGCAYRYEQDGKMFRGDGTECDSEGNPVAEATPPAPVAPPSTMPPASAPEMPRRGPGRPPRTGFQE